MPFTNSNSNATDFHDGKTDANDDDFNTPRLYYPSNLHGQYICDAVTGAKLPWRVGSANASHLFKVTDSSGVCDKNGFLVKSAHRLGAVARQQRAEKPGAFNTRDPNHCYYTSPAEYEKHRSVQVDPDIVAAWTKRTSKNNLEHGQVSHALASGQGSPIIVK